MTHDEALMIVNEEYRKAMEKHGVYFQDESEAVEVMTEEYNEVLEAFKNNDIKGKHGIVIEVAQLAAVCLKILNAYPTPGDWIGGC